MTRLVDLDKTDFDGNLYLPWNGTRWCIEEPSAKESERLRSTIWQMESDEEIHEMRKLLGQTWNDLLDAGIGWAHLLHIGRTALLHFTNTPEVSEGYWRIGSLATLLDLDLIRQAAKGA